MGEKEDLAVFVQVCNGQSLVAPSGHEMIFYLAIEGLPSHDPGSFLTLST